MSVIGFEPIKQCNGFTDHPSSPSLAHALGRRRELNSCLSIHNAVCCHYTSFTILWTAMESNHYAWCFKPLLYHWSYLSFFAGEEWIEHSTLCLTGTRSATELLSQIVVPVGFEPTQPSLKVRCSTTELRNIIFVDPERFERSHE